MVVRLCFKFQLLQKKYIFSKYSIFHEVFFAENGWYLSGYGKKSSKSAYPCQVSQISLSIESTFK